jgi:hypothetical protein
MQFYIPEPKYHHDSDNAFRLVYILEEMGIKVFCNSYIPFGEMDYSFLDSKDTVVCYGSLNVIKDVQRRGIPLCPFAWCDFDELRCSNYLAYWGQYSAQRLYAFYPLNEIARNKEFIYKTFGKDDRLFIRPDDNMKTFTGQIVSWQMFDHWWRHCRDYEGGPNCPCLVSCPEKIEREWRLFIKEGAVITGSQYMEHGHLAPEEGFPDAVGVKAEEVIKSTLWEPHPIYVMDIALVEGDYRLLEIGSINAAGMYKGDLKKIAKAIVEVAENGL